MKRSDVVRMMQRFSVPVGSDDPEATALGAPPLHQVTDATCPDCGEEITYRSCQQPDTEFIAELALWVHRREVHGYVKPLDFDLVGRAFAQILDAREADGE